MNSVLKTLALLMTFIVMAGCSTIKHSYPGSKRSLNEIALVKGFHERGIGKMEGLYIVGVDGKKFLHANEYPHGVYLLPGEHDMTIQYWNSGFYSAVEKHIGYRLSVSAGETYNIKHSRQDNLVRIWVEDISGEIVGQQIDSSVKPTIYGWQ